MKKTLFVAIFLGLTLLPTPSFAQVSPASSQEVNDLHAQLIALLTELLTQLQQQLADMIAKQSATDSTVTKIESKIDSVVQNATPSQVSVPVAPQLASVLNLSYSCDGNRIKVDVNQNGPYTRGLFHVNSGKGIDGTNYGGGSVWYPKDWPNGFTTYFNQAGEYNVTISLFDTAINDKNADKSFLSRTDQISIAECK